MWDIHACRVRDKLVLFTPILAVLMLSASATAEESAYLSFQEAVRRTQQHNPALQAFAHQLSVQQSRVTQARQRQNLELGVTAENAFGSGEFDGVDSAETTVSLGWVMERGKRARRTAVARAGFSLLESRGAIQQLDAMAETARLFLASLAQQKRGVVTRAAVTLARQTVAAIGKRVKAGRAPDADLARAEASLARMLLADEEVTHKSLIANHRLAAQWGKSRPDFSRVSGNVDTLPSPASFASLLSRLSENPDFSLYLSEHRLRAAELQLAEAKTQPSWHVNAGIRRYERTEDHALIAGITLPLATRDYNQGLIAEAGARLAMTEADQIAKRRQLETRLFVLYQGLQHSLHEATALREQVLPRVERALSETQQAYDKGRYGYSELLRVQTEMLSTRTAVVEASIAAHRHAIEIERLTGAVLMASVTKSDRGVE